MRAARASVPLLDAMGILYGLFLWAVVLDGPILWPGASVAVGVCDTPSKSPLPKVRYLR